jgi:hypothetical protein
VPVNVVRKIVLSFHRQCTVEGSRSLRTSVKGIVEGGLVNGVPIEPTDQDSWVDSVAIYVAVRYAAGDIIIHGSILEGGIVDGRIITSAFQGIIVNGVFLESARKRVLLGSTLVRGSEGRRLRNAIPTSHVVERSLIDCIPVSEAVVGLRSLEMID